MSDLYEKLYEKCYHCDGTGVFYYQHGNRCRICDGSGFIAVYVKRGTAASAPDVKEMERQSETEVMNGKTEK